MRLEDIYKSRPNYAFSKENYLQEMNDVPLFMKDLPQDVEDNQALAALQALAYEGSPREIAGNFKAQGNDWYKEGKYSDALEFYNKALAQDFEDEPLTLSLYLNRAACHLALKNYRKTLNDCSRVLEMDSHNVKALYRSAQACRSIEKFDQALDCISRALKLDPHEEVLSKEKSRIEQSKKEFLSREKQKVERLSREILRTSQLSQAVQSRNLRIEWSQRPFEPVGEFCVTLDQESKELIWPVVFLYPEFKQSDIVQCFYENSSFRDQLEDILSSPAPWDPEFNYTLSSAQVFYESQDNRLVAVDLNQCLKNVLEEPGYFIKDGVPNFILLSSKTEFTNEYKRMYHLE